MGLFGVIDEIAIYPTALTTTQITNHHNTGDMEADTLTAHGALKQECIDLAEELDLRLEQFAAVENAMNETI